MFLEGWIGFPELEKGEKSRLRCLFWTIARSCDKSEQNTVSWCSRRREKKGRLRPPRYGARKLDGDCL